MDIFCSHKFSNDFLAFFCSLQDLFTLLLLVFKLLKVPLDGSMSDRNEISHLILEVLELGIVLELFWQLSLFRVHRSELIWFVQRL